MSGQKTGHKIPDVNLTLLIMQISVSLLAAAVILTNRAVYYYDRAGYLKYLEEPLFLFEILALGLFVFIITQLFSSRGKTGVIPGDRNQVMAAVFGGLLTAAAFLLLRFKYDSVYARCFDGLIAALVISVPAFFVFENAARAGKDKSGISGYVPLFLFLSALTAVIFLRTFSFHSAFFTEAKDTGIYFNAMWNMIDSNTQFTCIEGFIDHRGVHLQPLMHLFAPLMRLGNAGFWLFFLQAFFLGLSGFYMFKLAEKLLNNRQAAFLIMLAFCISPYFYRITDFNFHFSSVYAAAVLALLYYTEKGSFLAVIITAVLAACVKEETAFYTVFILLFAGFRKKEIKYLILSSVILAYALIAVCFIIPSFSTSNTYFSGQVLGSIFSLKSFLNPVMLVQLLFFVAGTGFIAAYPSAASALLLLPPLIVQTAAFNPVFQLFFFYHSAVVTPALFAAALYNYEKISPKLKKPDRWMLGGAYLILAVQCQYHAAYAPLASVFESGLACILLLIYPYMLFKDNIPEWVKQAVAAGAVILYFMVGYGSFYNFRLDFTPLSDRITLREAIRHLPENKNIPVIANTIIVPHVSDRKYVNFLENEDAFRAAAMGNTGEFYVLEYAGSYQNDPYDRHKYLRKLEERAFKAGYRTALVFVKESASVYRYEKTKH